MAVKTNRIAYGVRVKLNTNFKEKCLSDKYLKEEKILWIAQEKPYNDANGYNVLVRGGSLINSGMVYLNEIDLEFEVPERPLYTLYGDSTEQKTAINGSGLFHFKTELSVEKQFEILTFYKSLGEKEREFIDILIQEGKDEAQYFSEST
jgi:hypothetical protein